MDALLLHPPTMLDATQAKASFMYSLLMGYGMLSVGACLKREGYQVECWNIPAFYYQGLSEKNVLDMIRGASPIVVGIELNWLHFSKGAIELARSIKNMLPETKVILGGVHQTLFGEYVLKNYDFIDGTCIGEAEKTFIQMMRKTEKGHSLRDVKGIIARDDGKIFDTGPPEIFADLDELPPYSLRMVKPKLSPPNDVVLINTCRGPCIHSCKYCIGNRQTYSSSKLSPRTALDVHSPSWIIAQMQYLLRDASKIAIQDYIYCRPKVLRDYAKEIQAHPELVDKITYFNLAALPGSLTGEILHELSLAGVDSIDYGIETGSEKILRLLGRPYTRKEVLETLQKTCQNGIIPKTYWMVGLPGETPAEIQETKEFMVQTISQGGIPKWVTPLCIFPTLELYENAPQFQLTPRFQGFEEYMVFSETTMSLKSDYFQVITHEMENVTCNKIMSRANDLKSFILQQRELILKTQRPHYATYGRYHQRLTEDELENWIILILNSLKVTFF